MCTAEENRAHGIMPRSVSDKLQLVAPPIDTLKLPGRNKQ
jgi:hypothetical protein